jgi:hypothetical protein
MGRHRETVRRLVAEGDADPERIMPLVLEWIQRQAQADPDFAFSVMEEFGHPVPPSMVKAIHEAIIAASGDPARAQAFLHEALDERENPKAADTAWGAVLDTFMEALADAIQDEIQRHNSQ